MASVLTTNVPYNARLMRDSNYYYSQSYATAIPVFDFVQATPFPTVTDKVNFTLTAQVPANSSASLTVQHSSDNSTWVTVPQLTAPLINTGSVAGVGVVSTNFNLESDSLRYVRVSSSVQVLTGTTGSLILVANM